MSQLASSSDHPRAARTLALAALVAAAGACGGRAIEPPRVTETAAPSTAAEDPARVQERLLARESGPLPKHEVSLLGGVVTSRIESASAPRIECNDATYACEIHVDLGADPDLRSNEIPCVVAARPLVFGLALSKLVGNATLSSAPSVQVAEEDGALRVDFVSDAREETDPEGFTRTLKLAATYTHGFSALCVDALPGNRATFARIAGGFFESLALKSRDVFTMASQTRIGERGVGFEFTTIVPRIAPAEGSSEIYFTSWIEEKGTTDWRIRDAMTRTVFDATGKVVEMAHSMWSGGGSEIAVIAKAADDAKYRVRLQKGGHSESLEMKPPARPNSLLGSAASFRALAHGSSPGFSFAVPTTREGEPAFGTFTYKPSSGKGVVLQWYDDADGAKAKMSEADATELHVDARGIVTKTVEARSTSELLFTTGTLPTTSHRAGGGR